MDDAYCAGRSRSTCGVSRCRRRRDPPSPVLRTGEAASVRVRAPGPRRRRSLGRHRLVCPRERPRCRAAAHADGGNGGSDHRVTTAIVLFTRDLHVHDHPALAEAVEHSERIAPLFVLDDGILATRFAARTGSVPPRLARRSRRGARQRAGALVVRRVDVVAEVMRLAREVGTATVYLSAESTPTRRHAKPGSRKPATRSGSSFGCAGATVVAPGDIDRAGSCHFKVSAPTGASAPGAAPSRPRAARARSPPGRTRREMERSIRSRRGDLRRASTRRSTLRGTWSWMRSGLATYGERHDDLPAMRPSGSTVSPPRLPVALELDVKLHGRPGASASSAGLLARFLPPAVAAARGSQPRGLPHRETSGETTPKASIAGRGAHGVPDRRRGHAPARA